MTKPPVAIRRTTRPGARAALAMAWLLGGGAIGAAPPEDEAHRLDRLETRQLNLHALATRPSPAPGATRPPATRGSAAEEALRQREQQAIDRWRAAATACRAAGRPDDC